MSAEQKLSEGISLPARNGYFLNEVDRMSEQFVGPASDIAAAIETTAHSIVAYADPDTESHTRQAARDRYQRATSHIGPDLSQQIKNLYVDIMDDEA